MDHEVLSSSTGPNATGWDWFAIQLDSNEELMLYYLKDSNGAVSEYSSGTIVRSDGSLVHLSRDDFSIKALSQWTSPATDITYPAKWSIHIPSENYALTVIPTIAAQELSTERSTGMTYWEGRCLVTGTHQKKLVRGSGYTELVGYKQSQ
jgi:predicted secreted hydrolase